MSYYNIPFKGDESAGSIAYLSASKKCNNQNYARRVSFGDSQPDYFIRENGEKKNSPITTVAILGSLAALVIGGLGYAHKTKAISKLSEGKFKEYLSKLEPATKKCYEWCSGIKRKSNEYYNTVKDKFNSSKN